MNCNCCGKWEVAVKSQRKEIERLNAIAQQLGEDLAEVHRDGMLKAACICRDLGTPDGLFLSSEIRKAAEEAE